MTKARNEKSAEKFKASLKPANADKESKVAQMLKHLEGDIEVFQSQRGIAYGTVRVSKTTAIAEHTETLRLTSARFKDYIRRVYHLVTKARGTLSSQTVTDLIDTFTSKAMFEGPELHVNLRVAQDDNGDVIIDRGTKDHSIVRIKPGIGWSIETASPVKFERSSGHKALPTPTPGGSLDTLRDTLRLKHESWILLRAYLVYCLIVQDEYPILIAEGPHGAAKSTLCNIVRTLIDNHSPLSRALPDSDEDLAVEGTSNMMLSYDNLSGLTPRMSDSLCRIATKSGIGRRKHYNQEDEVTYEFTRPILLNGIDDLAARLDLADRAIFIPLPRLTKAERQAKKRFWQKFDAQAGGILGALYSLLSLVLEQLPEVEAEEEELPRMADFAIVGIAIERALHESPGSFLLAYNGAQEEAISSNLETDPLALSVIQAVTKSGTGIVDETPTEMLRTLTRLAGRGAMSPAFPRSEKSIRKCLGRIAPGLEEICGILVSWGRQGDRRSIILRQLPKEDRHSSQDRHPETIGAQGNDDNDENDNPVFSNLERRESNRGPY